MQTEPLQITSSSSATSKSPSKRPACRHWPPHQKREIVEKTLVPGASVATIARQHDLNANMLFRWRREYQRGEFGPAPKQCRSSPDFVPVGVIGEDGKLLRSMPDERIITVGPAGVQADRIDAQPAATAAPPNSPREIGGQAEAAVTTAPPGVTEPLAGPTKFEASRRAAPASEEVSLAGRVEIELSGRARFSFDASLDETAIRRLIRLIKELT
jgi:transposase